MNLTPIQKEAIKELAAARAKLERSGLKLALIDEFLYAYKKADKLSFDTINELDNVQVLKDPIASYGT